MDSRTKYVYVVLSQTPTKFGGLIRKVEKMEYNHASIAFDENLESMYSFARNQNDTPIIGGLVKEFPERFSLNKVDYVGIKIYRLEVSEDMYEKARLYIECMLEDEDEYLYNLFSVLTYPLFRGFSTFKAFSCAEFTAHILLLMGVTLEVRKKLSGYTPEDIGACLGDNLFYEGNLLTYSKNAECEEADYFFEKQDRLITAKKSIFVLWRLIYRKIKWYY